MGRRGGCVKPGATDSGQQYPRSGPSLPEGVWCAGKAGGKVGATVISHQWGALHSHNREAILPRCVSPASQLDSMGSHKELPCLLLARSYPGAFSRS